MTSSGVGGRVRRVSVEMINVLVVEDHDLVAYALTKVLEAEGGIKIVATTGNGDRALALVASHPVDVIVLDRRIDGGVDGIDLIEKFREVSPGVRVLLLSGTSDDRSVARAVEAGCHGYLVKDQSVTEVVSAVLAVSRGEMVFAPSVMPRVMRMLRPQGARTDELSPREVEVLQLLADGSTTAEIAAALFVSTNTVRNHISSIIRKLGVHSRLEAVSLGIKQGLVDVS